MRPAARLAIVGFVNPTDGVVTIGCHRQQQARQFVDIDRRHPPWRGEQRDAAAHHAEQVEHVGIAGAEDGGRPDDGPVERAFHHHGFGAFLRPAIVRQRRLARGERRDMDEARHPRVAGGRNHIGGRGGIARLERGARRHVDDAGDVQHRIGARDHCGQAVGPVERAVDPGHAIARLLRPPRQRAHLPAGGDRPLQCRTADEAGRAGHGQNGRLVRRRHNRTRWSRWTIAARGA